MELKNKTVEPMSFVSIGRPNIWYCNRVLIVEREGSVSKNLLKDFLNLSKDLSKLGKPINAIEVLYSCVPNAGRCFHGGKVCFSHAVEGDGWIIEWGMKYCDTGEPVKKECEEAKKCALYFTGIGCPHCALSDPWLFYEFVPKSDLVLIEYEFYKIIDNGKVFDLYLSLLPEEKRIEYGGVPQIVFDLDHILIGDIPILQGMNNMKMEVGECKWD